MITKPLQQIVKFIASASQPILANPAVNHIVAGSLGERAANFGLRDTELIVGQVRSELAGTLTIYQGFSDIGGTVHWVVKDTVAVGASTYSAGFVDGSGTKISISVAGEVCKVDFLITAGGPNNNFELGLWCH